VSNVRRFLKAHPLWVGFLPVILPLLLLLGMQYVWLVRLEEASAIADRAALATCRDAIVSEVLYEYGASAERLLNVPAYDLQKPGLERVATHFASRSFAGARRPFVVRFGEDEPEIWFYHAETGTLEAASDCDEERAVTLAATSWQFLHEHGVEMDAARLSVEERDPGNRIVLYPILNSSRRLVGLTGFVLDTGWFRTEFLPRVVGRILPKFFQRSALREIQVTVSDGGGRRILAISGERPGEIARAADEAGTAGENTPLPQEVSGPFSLVFTDWSLGIGSRRMTSEQWAHSNFGFNLALSLLTALILIAGIVLAMRTFSREMRLSQMKEDFVSNVSHELRTPVASIRVMGEFLKRGVVTAPEKIREYGAFIESESRRLTQLINNILDFSRIESGQKTYALSEGDPTPVVAEVLKSFDVQTRDQGFEIVWSPPEKPLPLVRFDPEALGQAVYNLVDNAIKYSGESRRVEVGMTNGDGGVTIRVSDRGIGIPRDEQDRIFERFHRVSTGLVHDIKGNGLGLSLVKHIVEAHGGRVAVSSVPGSGSTFTIRLPASEASQAPLSL